MAIFKCKMCGGSLEIQENTGVAVCEYCGSEQTIPRGDDDVRTNLFNRANNLRLKCEFDKAQQVYDKILNADNTDAEAHWGAVLCKYGIEYVEDPKTHKRIPTCHRTQYESVLTDVDYLAAIENADATQRGVYTTQALDISRLQKDILAIVKNEKPFDVFLCYKETDENGKRTVDSSLANDIYYQLTQEGMKVFYAAITLEGKLGQEYEPYIFAALHSAKVMLVIGTKPEYFEAVWVRNEWSRFLSIMKTDRSKLLIPCYRDMDAYDLPEAFSHLQAQDMSKIGFVNDVVRGIRKVVSGGETEKAVPAQPAASAAAGTNVAGLLKRAYIFLEDGKWTEADEYCEKVLDNDPECAEAYLGKLLAELHVHKREQLKDTEKPFDQSDNCQKAGRFDAAIAQELADANACIRERNLAAEKEAKRIADEKRKEDIYRTAFEIASNAVVVSSFECAIEKFDSIPDYKDARTKADECRKIIEELKVKQEKEEAERKQREAEEAEAKRIADEKRKKLIKKTAIIGTPIVAVLIVFLIVLGTIIVPSKHYTQAIQAKENGQVFTSMLEFRKAGHYKDSKTQLQDVSLQYQKSISGLIDVGYYHRVGLRSDGTVATTESNWKGECRVDSWTDIVAVAAGSCHTVGLRSDGTVVATGDNEYGECDVDGWTDIVAVAAGHDHTIGLRRDGTVVATGYNRCDQCDVNEWTDIVAIVAGGFHSVGLRADGTVVATKIKDWDYSGYDWGQSDVDSWTDIVAVAAGSCHTVGLRSDGTVVATGKNDDGQCDVDSWTDIVAVAAGWDHTVGLRSDGTVVANGKKNDGVCDVGGWADIVAVAAGCDYSVGLRLDGTAVETETKDYYGHCDVSEWKNLKLPTVN